MSHPTWVRGLKHEGKKRNDNEDVGRTLRGCVD